MGDCEIDVIKDRRNFWPFQYLYRVLNILKFQKMDDQNQLMSREQRGEGRISMKGRLDLERREKERERERGKCPDRVEIPASLLTLFKLTITLLNSLKLNRVTN